MYNPEVHIVLVLYCNVCYFHKITLTSLCTGVALSRTDCTLREHRLLWLLLSRESETAHRVSHCVHLNDRESQGYVGLLVELKVFGNSNLI